MSCLVWYLSAFPSQWKLEESRNLHMPGNLTDFWQRVASPEPQASWLDCSRLMRFSPVFRGDAACHKFQDASTFRNEVGSNFEDVSNKPKTTIFQPSPNDLSSVIVLALEFRLDQFKILRLTCRQPWHTHGSQIMAPETNASSKPRPKTTQLTCSQ